MEPDRDAILRALDQVIDPELHAGTAGVCTRVAALSGGGVISAR